jgi:hypothetical protein
VDRKVRIAEIDGLPPRNELRRHLEELMSDWPTPPDESMLRKVLRRLYEQPWLTIKENKD